jgi:hypothetical protein
VHLAHGVVRGRSRFVDRGRKAHERVRIHTSDVGIGTQFADAMRRELHDAGIDQPERLDDAAAQEFETLGEGLALDFAHATQLGDRYADGVESRLVLGRAAESLRERAPIDGGPTLRRGAQGHELSQGAGACTSDRRHADVPPCGARLRGTGRSHRRRRRNLGGQPSGKQDQHEEKRTQDAHR